MQRVDRSQFVGEQIAQPLEMKGKSLRFVKYCNLIFLFTRRWLLVCTAGVMQLSDARSTASWIKPIAGWISFES